MSSRPTLSRTALSRPDAVARLALAILAAAVTGWALLIPPTRPVAIDGLCLYGTRARSLGPFLLGMALLCACCVQIGRLLRPTDRRASGALIAVGLCMIGIVATPFTVSGTVNAVHVTFGTALFLLQLLVAYRIARSPVAPVVWLLLVVLAVGDLLALAALALDTPTMWVGQLLSQAAFLALLACHGRVRI